MRKFLQSLGLAAFLIGAACTHAHAQALYAGLLGGYASSTDKQNDVEPYGVGFGASAGITLPVLPIFVGARFLYFLGEDASIDAGAGRLTLDSHYVMYGLDFGYDATLGPITLRPGFGIGRATVENSGSAIGVKVSAEDSSLYLAPGVGLIVSAGLLYASAELRFNYLTEDEHNNNVSMLAGFGLTI